MYDGHPYSDPCLENWPKNVEEGKMFRRAPPLRPPPPPFSDIFRPGAASYHGIHAVLPPPPPHLQPTYLWDVVFLARLGGAEISELATVLPRFPLPYPFFQWRVLAALFLWDDVMIIMRVKRPLFWRHGRILRLRSGSVGAGPDPELANNWPSSISAPSLS